MKDEKDKEILGMLRRNARVANVEMARRIGLSEGAVRVRIARMVKDGTIEKFTIETREAAESQAIVVVKAKKDTKTMMQEIAKLGVARYAYEISGMYDGCLVIEGESVHEIDEKIDQLRSLKSVQDTHTFIVMKKW